MGFFDYVEKRANQQQKKAATSYRSQLSSKYHETDDSARKSAIAKQIRETDAIIRSLK